jgi:hypothetical protein
MKRQKKKMGRGVAMFCLFGFFVVVKAEFCFVAQNGLLTPGL